MLEKTMSTIITITTTITIITITTIIAIIVIITGVIHHSLLIIVIIRLFIHSV